MAAAMIMRIPRKGFMSALEQALDDLMALKREGSMD
jgi:hypothetical protein